jgi:hypothetical protein
MNEIEKWLKSLGLEKYINIFNQHEIHNKESLELLTKDDFIEMGIEKLGERNLLLYYIKNFDGKINTKTFRKI